MFMLGASLPVFSAYGEGEAHATSLRVAPTVCSAREDDDPSYVISGEQTNSDYFATGLKYYFCPFVEFGDFRKVDVSILNVYFYDGDATLAVYARACWHDYSGTQLYCAGWDENLPATGTGYVTLTPSLATWNTTSGMAYVEVALALDSYLEGLYLAS
jgi:hypothetical protein